jgi:hypothetical protein
VAAAQNHLKKFMAMRRKLSKKDVTPKLESCLATLNDPKASLPLPGREDKLSQIREFIGQSLRQVANTPNLGDRPAEHSHVMHICPRDSHYSGPLAFITRSHNLH